MVLAPTLILAIDNFRLFRMQRQSAFSKPRRKSSPQCCGLVFIMTVTDRIIGIALEQYVRELSPNFGDGLKDQAAAWA